MESSQSIGPQTDLEIIECLEVIFFQLVKEFPELDTTPSFTNILKFWFGMGPLLKHLVDELLALLDVGKELGISGEFLVLEEIGLKFLHAKVHHVDI